MTVRPKYNFEDPILQRAFEDVYLRLGNADAETSKVKQSVGRAISSVSGSGGGVPTTPTSGLLPIPTGLTVTKVGAFGFASVTPYNKGENPGVIGFEFFGTQDLISVLPAIPLTEDYRIARGAFNWCTFLCRLFPAVQGLTDDPYRMVCRTYNANGSSTVTDEVNSNDIPDAPVLVAASFVTQRNGSKIYYPLGQPSVDIEVSWENHPAADLITDYEVLIYEEDSTKETF